LLGRWFLPFTASIRFPLSGKNHLLRLITILNQASQEPSPNLLRTVPELALN
jgi:hypothetical protein